MTRAQQTALFLVLALGGAYAIGWYWVTHPQHGWITQFLSSYSSCRGLS